jgi:hypothetical protein
VKDWELVFEIQKKHPKAHGVKLNFPPNFSIQNGKKGFLPLNFFFLGGGGLFLTFGIS